MVGSLAESADTWKEGRLGSPRRRCPVLIVAGDAQALGARRRVVRLADELHVGREPTATPGLALDDHLVSREHARIARGAEGFDIADLGSTNGTIVGGAAVWNATAPLHEGALIFLGGHAAAFWFVSDDDLKSLHDEVRAPFAPVGTASPRLARVTRQLRTLAKGGDVLLVGETGVGKEVYARGLHDRSGRSGAFVALNCAALPRELIEGELFGHVRGAHSQATADRAGLLERAEGGTLLLDEIGDMPPDVQAKLLRVVENREYYPLGARRPVRANLRVIAATNAPERIRKDLVHRLGNPVCLPRLDQRREDIPALIGHFLRGQKARSLEVAAFQAVMGYAWPGNVRELRKTMERAAAMAEEDGVETIGVEHLPGQVTRETREGSAHEAPEERPSPLSDHPVPPRQRRPSSVELRTLLEEHRGNVPQVARVLGRRREQVWRWCKADGVDPRGFRR